MSRYRLTIQKMLAENRMEAVADIMTELIRADILATATATQSIKREMTKAARFDWRSECKKSVVNQLAMALQEEEFISFKETILPTSVEIEGTIHTLRLDKL
ncbi:MAG TPA: hypothetical protein VK602_19140 [Phyllobacterium sp.]|nr:hypothetical protein [Phyllobacterium sp.]